MSDPIGNREYGTGTDTGTCIECEVVAFDLSAEPMVTVRPLKKTRVLGLDGEVDDLDPLDIEDVPYSFPSSSKLALFIPPEIGMQGFLMITNSEIGEAGDGKQETTRVKDRSSGYFLPSGRLNGPAFAGSADWAEMRASTARMALSDDTVHLQAGETNIVLSTSGFDVVSGGVSLVAALKQMSAHIRRLENLIHPGGLEHGPAQDRMVDQLTAAAVPQRQESGVR